jgi:hypothetical protein
MRKKENDRKLGYNETNSTIIYEDAKRQRDIRDTAWRRSYTRNRTRNRSATDVPNRHIDSYIIDSRRLENNLFRFPRLRHARFGIPRLVSQLLVHFYGLLSLHRAPVPNAIRSNGWTDVSVFPQAPEVKRRVAIY